MSQEQKYEMLGKLLGVERLYYLYRRIGVSILSKADIVSANFDEESVRNSVELLMELKLVDVQNDKYIKVGDESSKEVFSHILSQGLETLFSRILKASQAIEVKYDSGAGEFFIYRNSINLKYSGLMMLLVQLGTLRSIEERIYFERDSAFESHILRSGGYSLKPTTADDFRKLLEKRAEIGHEAEIEALKFERKRLEERGDARFPILISEIDVGAGYDIASYSRAESKVPDRFIEVKSRGEDGAFYLSRNEIKVSERWGDAYFLYLFDRTKRGFELIQNPFDVVVSGKDFTVIPITYAVRRI